MLYPNELIEEIRVQNDIVDVIKEYISLKQRGNSFVGLCPFHNEKTPSFTVSPDKQLYHCFGCGASGNVIGFIMQYEHDDFLEAVKRLAERVRIELPKPDYSQESNELFQAKQMIYDMHRDAGRFFYENLKSDHGQQAFTYLQHRQISAKTKVQFGLGFSLKQKDSLYQRLKQFGYADDLIVRSGLVMQKENGIFLDRFRNRIMFPIIDTNGKVVGFGGRIIDKGEPKYLNSPETIVFSKSRNLYGLNFAKKSKEKEMILVEGYMDVISLAQAGIDNAVATLGTAFNNEHATVLKRYCNEVVLVFDSDEAGRKATLRTIPVLTAHGFRTRVLQIPDGKDPDEYIKNHGAEAFQGLARKARNHIYFQVGLLQKQYDLDNTEQKVQFASQVSEILATVTSPVERDAYLKEMAQLTNISAEAYENEIKKQTLTKETKKSKVSFDRKDIQPVKELSIPKGLREAQAGLLNIIGFHPHLYSRVREYLSPEDFLTDVYQKLAEIMMDAIDQNKDIYPAEFANYFESYQEHREIANAFMKAVEYDDVKHMEKALNSHLIYLKKAKLEQQMQNITNENLPPRDQILLLKKLRDEETKLSGLYIPLTDG